MCYAKLRYLLFRVDDLDKKFYQQLLRKLVFNRKFARSRKKRKRTGSYVCAGEKRERLCVFVQRSDTSEIKGAWSRHFVSFRFQSLECSEERAMHEYKTHLHPGAYSPTSTSGKRIPPPSNKKKRKGKPTHAGNHSMHTLHTHHTGTLSHTKWKHAKPLKDALSWVFVSANQPASAPALGAKYRVED